MKAHRHIVAGILLMIGISFCGCTNKNSSIANGEAFFKNLKCYEATATVSFLKDQQINTIAMRQTVQMAGNYEMVYLSPKHLEGTTLSYDGEKIIETYPGSDQKIEEKVGVAENEILLTSFAKRFINGNAVKIQEATWNGRKAITYETLIEGEYKYLAKEKVWMDHDKMIPLQLEIYDTNDNISIQVIYENFKYNS